MIRPGVAVLALMLAACSSAPSVPAVPMTLEQAVASPARSGDFRDRDVYRHPLETLTFFEIEADMTVVEVWPGTGWYTEILAPFLRAGGQYVAAGFVNSPESSEFRRNLLAAFKAKLAAGPGRYDRVQLSELGPPDRWRPVAPASADRVLTFRNVHNWLAAGYEREMFAAFFRALKTGGMLGVVEHRARTGTSIEDMKRSGYVTQELVIQLATEAGFVYAGWSEINANERDTRDHPEGVWTLPPVLRLGERDRDKYLAIGESDRMTLRFVKP